MGLESPELSCQHLVVGITRNEHSIVEVTVLGHLVCVKRKPCVDSLLDDGCAAVVIDLTQMLVVEYHIILDESVLELPLVEEKMLAACIVDSVSASVVMTFGN